MAGTSSAKTCFALLPGHESEICGEAIGERSAKSHRPDFDHVRHEMLQQVLDAVLQCRRRRRAAGAGALHVEIDDPVLEAAEGDVAAVVGDCGAHPGLD